MFEKYNKYFKDKNENNTIDNLEKKYINSLKKIENSSYNKNELLLKDSFKLLEEELLIIKLLSKYTLQNNYLNYDFFFKCLDTILDISEILRNRIKQEPIEHKIKNTDNFIPRCSYKFCTYTGACTYNYNLKKKNICYQDHFVHNMVSADIKVLRNYMKTNFSDTKLILPNKEILKTINTLCFVIGHMHSELKSKCIYLKKNEIEKINFIKKK